MSKPKKSMLELVLKKRCRSKMASNELKALASMLDLLVTQYVDTHPQHDQSEMTKLANILREVYGAEFCQSNLTATGNRVLESIAGLMPLFINGVRTDLPNLSPSLEAIDWRVLFNVPPQLPPTGHVVVDPPTDDDSGGGSSESVFRA